MKQGNRLIVADTSWAESIPKWLLDAIESERMMNGLLIASTDSKDSFSDAEMVAYLMTASNRAPMSHNQSQIYFFLTSKVMIKYRGLTENNLPDMMQEVLKEGLNGDQEREMKELRSNLLSKRGKVNHPVFSLLESLKRGKF